jgi:(E)-4-hydroxy-3-methylbut-2-enyl-diphosphate synthase
MREALVVRRWSPPCKAEEYGLAGDKIILSAKVSSVQDLIAVYRDLAAAVITRCTWGSPRPAWVRRASSARPQRWPCLLQEGIGDTIRVSLTPEPNGSRTQEVIVAQEILQTMGLRAFTPMVTACPGCGPHHQHASSRNWPPTSRAIVRDNMPIWRERVRRRGEHELWP